MANGGYGDDVKLGIEPLRYGAIDSRSGFYAQAMYYLVTLLEPDEDFSTGIDHEGFIDSLIARQLVLLGGPLDGQRRPRSRTGT